MLKDAPRTCQGWPKRGLSETSITDGERVRSEESTRNRDKVVRFATGLERRGAYVVCVRVVVGYLLEEAGRLIGEGIQFVASPEKGRTRGVRRVELG